MSGGGCSTFEDTYIFRAPIHRTASLREMLSARVFPTLLLKQRGLYKGACFKEHRYVGDPINAIRIFNDKEVDEIAVLDIEASLRGVPIDADFVSQFSAECFVPLTVGGGISSVDQARRLLKAGAEKVLVNSAAILRPELIRELAETFGSSSVVVGIDYRKSVFGKLGVRSHCGSRSTRLDPVSWAKKAEELGAGEIVLTSIDRDGTGVGYDVGLLSSIASELSIPVVASGGLGSIDDIATVFRDAAVSAATGGSFFVFHGARRAVLISFPARSELERVINGK
jgi:cyclase